MKKLEFLSLLLLLILAGCNKEKGSGPVWFQVDIRLIDSSGNLLFPDYSLQQNNVPFDPIDSYWLNSLGSKFKFHDKNAFPGTPELGLIFGLSQELPSLEMDTRFTSTNTIHWQVFFHPDSTPYHLQIVNPDFNSQKADFIIWNEDTLVRNNVGSLKITYP
jgi:hypothetical protein